MSLTQRQEPLRLPDTLESQLHAFRRRVWTIKLSEAAGVASCAVMLAFLAVFALDRLWDTPRWLRLAAWAGALCGCGIIPLYLHHWVWRLRGLEQLARLLTVKLPRLGDQLLGIIELVHSEGEQTRSRTLCEAAVRCVAQDAQKYNLCDASPNSRHRVWGWLAAVAVVAVVGLGVAFPLAVANAWQRFFAPWGSTPRYTFAALEALPEDMVVPHGEPFQVNVRLAAGTRWQPVQGQVQLDKQPPVQAALQDGGYQFELPAQISEGLLWVNIGDARQRIRIKPMFRPELTAIVAEVTLPAYLGQSQPLSKDVRGGTVALVKGSEATFTATASRTLSAASVDGQPRTPEIAAVHSLAVPVDETRKVEFQWQDEYGLAGKEAFTLTVTACEDEAPSLACEDLPRSKVVLDSEQLNFRIKADDDFGVKEVGLEWQGIEEATINSPAEGERILAAGGCEKRTLEASGVFSAQSLEIEPQPIQLRVYAEDYLPGRKRVYSPTYVLYVLNAEQHAIWITEQLNKWHRQSLEVRDRELQLYETNKQLRDLSPEELDQPDTRRRIENQAAAERANSRRLGNLTAQGDDVLRQAARNPQFDVGALERWAEMMQILKDIGAQRMPSVADLLDQASQARRGSAGSQDPNARKAGEVRATASGNPKAESPTQEKKTAAAVPKVADVESSLQPAEEKESSQTASNKPSQPSLRLPSTTVMGQAGDNPPRPPNPAGDKAEEAVRQQEDLLAEFEKIANELNNILANLEGSTLVKRLKAASREQYRVSSRVSDTLDGSFGLTASRRETPAGQALAKLSEVEGKSCENMSLIMDDMQAYFERRKFLKVKTVLDEMKSQDVLGGLRELADGLPEEPGLSIAQCEFWWDTLDRWAEDLVDPACKGSCQCSGSRESLPPAIVLEVLKILEGEINLREETRVAEQARLAQDKEAFGTRAQKLSDTQAGLKDRVAKATGQIRELPEGEAEFGREINLLESVAEVMGDAVGILARPETGPAAIGAETEAIELLLKSRRINPRGGGGGGASPGGGGSGTTSDSAIALLGIGVNEKEVRSSGHATQAVGDSGRSLPEEFRAGLDEYFNRLERRNP